MIDRAATWFVCELVFTMFAVWTIAMCIKGRVALEVPFIAGLAWWWRFR